jgi:hypothetical protein
MLELGAGNWHLKRAQFPAASSQLPKELHCPRQQVLPTAVTGVLMRSFVLSCVATLLLAVCATAQDVATPPAHLSFVDGAVSLERDGEVQPAAINMPVLEGDRIRTANGRAEVMFPDGSTIAIDPNSDVELLGGTRVRVVAGAIEHRAAVQSSGASPSVQNLPPDLQAYGPDLDQNGAWGYEAPYGNVWYPTVAADWRPYYDGYWSSVPAYGATWIGYSRWSWPTHHYGRWGFARSRWFWIPGRTWSSAWVSWGSASDYVGWCPLGFDNRPVVALSLGYRRSWDAWTVVPRDRFLVRGAAVRRYAVDPGRISTTTPFLIHRSAPFARPDAGGGYAQTGGRTYRINRQGQPDRGRQSSSSVASGFSRTSPGTGLGRTERDRYDRGRAVPSAPYRTPSYSMQPSAPVYRAQPSAPSSRIQPALPYRQPSAPSYRAEPSAPRYRAEPSVPRYRAEPIAPSYRAEPSAPRYRAEPSAPRYRAEPVAPSYRAQPQSSPAPAPSSRGTAVPRGGGQSQGHARSDGGGRRR